jgi:hypothetical protein
MVSEATGTVLEATGVLVGATGTVAACTEAGAEPTGAEVEATGVTAGDTRGRGHSARAFYPAAYRFGNPFSRTFVIPKDSLLPLIYFRFYVVEILASRRF